MNLEPGYSIMRTAASRNDERTTDRGPQVAVDHLQLIHAIRVGVQEYATWSRRRIGEGIRLAGEQRVAQIRNTPLGNRLTIGDGPQSKAIIKRGEGDGVEQ